jgi:predicted Zn-dependent peptidase
VLNQALGGGMASRLFQEVRERRGLAYSVYSFSEAHTDTGSFAVYAGTSPKKVPTTLDVIRTELDRARREGITDAELTRAKGYLAGSMLLALEDTGSRMGRLGKSITTDSELLTLDETLAAVEAVDHDAVREVAAELLTGPFTLAVVGPVGDLDEAALAASCAPS